MLAWLSDRSKAIASGLVRVFFSGDRKAIAAVRAGGPIATTVQPEPSGAPRRRLPGGLSLAGEDRSFQLLIEAKLGAPFERRRVGRKTLLQPDAYIRAWERSDPEHEAKVRGVGDAEARWRAAAERRT